MRQIQTSDILNTNDLEKVVLEIKPNSFVELSRVINGQLVTTQGRFNLTFGGLGFSLTDSSNVTSSFDVDKSAGVVSIQQLAAPIVEPLIQSEALPSATVANKVREIAGTLLQRVKSPFANLGGGAGLVVGGITTDEAEEIFDILKKDRILASYGNLRIVPGESSFLFSIDLVKRY